MKRFALTTLGVLGLMVLGSTAADAGGIKVTIGGFSGHGGHGGHAAHGAHGFQGGHDAIYGGVPSRNWRTAGIHGGGHFDAYHDTSHYDWVPGHWVWHHGHYDWVPGRYVLHVEGHVDHVYPDHVHHGGH